MITIENASIYSTNGEMAYQINYSDGTIIRAVESPNRYIRNEYLKNGEWVQSGKPYIVSHNKHRNAERTKANAINFLN
jgi:hypothetical protein